MNTYDYYGWTVSDEDVLYHKLIEKDINIIDADKDQIKEIIDNHVTNQTVALDIGCHYGFITEFLAKHFVAVHAFDFDNDIHDCFKQNMQKFNCTNVIAHAHGLGDVNKMVATNDWFARHGRRGPLGNHIDPQGKNANQQIKTVDELAIKNVGLIMIDTEGFELMVLKGADITIKTYWPVIVLEYHHKNLTEKFGYKKEKIIEHLEQQLGYVNHGYINKVDLLFVKE